PSLLVVDDVQTPLAGYSVQHNFATPGTALITFFGAQALGVGSSTFLTLSAHVPAGARYGAGDLLHFSRVSLNENRIGALGLDAVHVAALLVDVNDDETYTLEDARPLARVVVGLDTGFVHSPAVDPRLVGDVTGNGTLSGLDAARIAQQVAGLHPVEIPPAPSTGSSS